MNSNEISDNWNVGKTFKTTPKIIKEGKEKMITEIRMALNKLSKKNYDIQCNILIDLVGKMIEIEIEAKCEENITNASFASLPQDAEQNSESSTNEIFLDGGAVPTSDVISTTIHISKVIFDIASSNKMISDLYAKLYKQLIDVYDDFKSKTSVLLDNYKITFNEIHYIDPNVDYDGYCKYTKSNDIRKAMTLFTVHLMCNDILNEKSIIDTIIFLEEMILKYAEESDRTNEVEEITENVFILITQSIDVLKNSEEWTEKIVPTIHELSKLRKTNGAKYPSMSSRATFKYMDILDALN